MNKISHNEIMSCVEHLPEMQRNVLILRCLVGLSIDETAEQLNISISAANKNLTLARRAIKRFIDERNGQQ